MDRREDMKAAGLRTFIKIADRWGLSEPERHRWLGVGGSEACSDRPCILHADLLDDRAMIRISLVLGIYEALHSLFDLRFADLWISSPNQRFGGNSVKDVVTDNPERLSEIRAFLERELNS